MASLSASALLDPESRCLCTRSGWSVRLMNTCFSGRRFTRRTLLRLSVITAGEGVLVACGNPATPALAPTASAKPTQAPPTAAAATSPTTGQPVSGGVLHLGAGAEPT